MICLFLVSGCTGNGAGQDAVSVRDRKGVEWVEALWTARDPEAYTIWSQVDERTKEGRRIRRLLRQADVHYREGIRLLKKGESGAARLAFKRGVSLAPINPEHYYTLADFYRKRQMNESASQYYIKYARAVPDSEKAEEAVALARRFDPTVNDVFDPPRPLGEMQEKRQLKFNVLFLLAGASVGAAFVVLMLFLVRPYFSAGASLSKLIDQAPELHSAIAYLIGSLRHELLKHRIGVMADVLNNLRSQQATGPQLDFLGKRLYNGVPVDEAWHAHVNAFSRALGERFNMKRDRRFRRADKAIRRIAVTEAVYAEKGPGALAALGTAHLHLKQFDKYLAEEQSRLVRTLVNTTLLLQVEEEVRGEYAVSSVPISDMRIEEVKTPVYIEVPRVDLLLILKNLFRNAILAVADAPSPRGVGIGVRISLEPTGQESVRIRVTDTSSKSIAPDQMDKTHPESGLALVMTAVKRYGGTLDIEEDGERGKAVAIRFFRAFEDNGEAG
jgi:tetratricopeptide (TPR) repeat protein